VSVDAKTWVSVAPATAQTHPLYGVGGWLILVVFGMVAAPIRIATELYPIYSTIDFGSLAPEFLTLVYIEIGMNALFVVWSFVNVALIFLKHPALPTSLIALLASSAMFVIGDAITVKMMLDKFGQSMSWYDVFTPDTIKGAARSTIGAAIWIPYALYSRRVNVTYRLLVRRDDPAASEKIAEAF
jgi:Protein of unknown function (DUF2569)